jgi:hypothetical protein
MRNHTRGTHWNRIALVALLVGTGAILTTIAGGLAVRSEAQTCSPVQPCGDVDDSGDVKTSDALKVLRQAVGHEQELVCLCEEGPASPPTAYVHSTSGIVSISASGGSNAAATINPMFLSAGTYLVTFTGTVVNFGPIPDLFRCGIYVAGEIVAFNTVDLGDPMTVAPMTVQTVVTVTFGGTTAVGSTCLHDNNLPPEGAYYVDPGATLTAVPIASGS